MRQWIALGLVLLAPVICGAGDRKASKNSVEYFSEQIQKQPTNAELWYSRGKIRDDNGDHENAIVDYSEAIRLDPTNAQVYVKRAEARIELDDYDNAILDYSEAILRFPTKRVLYSRRATAWLRKLDFEKAIEDLTEVIRLKPDDAEGYTLRGKVWERKGDLDKAIEDFTQAIRFNGLDEKSVVYIVFSKQGFMTREYKPYPQPYIDRGRVLDEKGEFAAAVKDFTEAIEIKPDNSKYYCYRGDSWARKGELDKAIDDYVTALELDPAAGKNCYRLDALAGAYARKGEFASAVKWAEKALKQASDRGASEQEMSDCQLQLELYRANKPYQAVPPSPKPAE